MCGLLGCFNLSGFNVASRLERIAHRGPDGSGVLSQDAAIHGHVRLALLDLTDASAQPFRRPSGGLLSFNGEIWNYRQVRAELEGMGETFTTTGDTEVLAAALDRWDMAALSRLEGMFAFAWSKGHRHLLVRDRYGKVPLYVSRKGLGYAWASERKGLGAGWPARPLPPASVLDLTTGRLQTWYRLPAGGAGTVTDALETGVRARLVTDAPLCCLISGGLDSALVLSLAKRHAPGVVAYTAVLDETSKDRIAARRLCAEIEVPLVEVKVAPPTAADLATAARAIEIPSKAQVEIAALCLPLARAIAADGFKACLSGEAADELFGGYGNLCIQGASVDDSGWRALRVAQLAKMARGNFIRCNKAFMAHGVECRLPFMERSLVELVLGMGKRDCPPGKGGLKRAAAGIIPDWVLRRVKDTFQGGSGMDQAAARIVADPRAFYRAEVSHAYGLSALAR